MVLECHSIMATTFQVPSLGGCPVQEGTGFTPDIALAYRAPGLIRWGVGYGDLISTGVIHTNDILGTIILTPDAGWNVVVESFDLGWSVTEPNQVVRIVDVLTGNTLWDASPYLGIGPSGHHSFTPFVSHHTAVRIEFGPRNVGIDNLSFSQVTTPPTAAVPEPSSLLLVGAGIAGFILRRRS